MSAYNFGSYSLDAHGSADGAGNVDAIGVQLPANCWTKAPPPPRETEPNPWIKETPAQTPLGSPAAQWGRRCVADTELLSRNESFVPLTMWLPIACLQPGGQHYGIRLCQLRGAPLHCPGLGDSPWAEAKDKAQPVWIPEMIGEHQIVTRVTMTVYFTAACVV